MTESSWAAEQALFLFSYSFRHTHVNFAIVSNRLIVSFYTQYIAIIGPMFSFLQEFDFEVYCHM